jgi:PleD family two-component response regulator
MSFQVSPIALVVRAFQAARRIGRRRWLRPLLLGCLGCLTVGILAADPGPGGRPTAPPSDTPPQLDSYQREEMQRIAREETERYRMRVALPQAAFATRPHALPKRDRSAEAAAALRQEMLTPSVLKLLSVFAGAIIWMMIARKLAPELTESMVSWLPARALKPGASGGQLVALLAEEKAVAEFQKALCAGTRTSGLDDTADEIVAEGGPFAQAKRYIREMQKLLQEARASAAQAVQRSLLIDVQTRIRPLKNLAKPAELLPLWQVTCAVEMLLQQLTEKASNVTSSTLRTAALGVTVLEELCQPGLKSDLLSEPPLRLLVVDDETFSRFALSHALKRGLSEPDVAESGETALRLAGERPYDLIFLDVQMPGMDGFELCAKIHETLPNHASPVVFVTSMRDFDARANSILCGGRDLIAKPFLTFELTVKALTLVATERLRGRARLADATLADLEEAKPAAPAPETVPVPANDVAEALPKPVPARRRQRKLPVPPPMGEDKLTLSEPEGGFFLQAQVQIDIMRELVELIRQSEDPRVQKDMTTELRMGIHMLALGAEACGQESIALMSSALEGLLKKLLEKSANFSASTLQAVAIAAELIQDLCLEQPSPNLALEPPIRVLVVDDDPFALRAISNALQMRFSKPVSASDGKSAVALAMENEFDVIFLDVQMPDLNGFEVCTRIRQDSANSETPIVFLTGDDSPAMRAKSESCGGNDFISKSYLSSELNVKALALALRGRLENVREPVLETAG